MIGNISKQHLFNSLPKAQGFVGHAYNQTKGSLNHIDHGFRTATQIYHAVAPLVDKYANNHSEKIHHNINKAIGGYENIRNKVIQGDNDIQQVKKSIRGI